MERSKLVKKALESATPAQLIRVRAILARSCDGFGGGTAVQRSLDRTLAAFDNEEYESSEVVDFLHDKELGDALR